MMVDVLTRRSFAAAAAGAALTAGGDVVLEAVSGARLPATLAVARHVAADHRFFELRAYSGRVEMPERLLVRAGMRPHKLGAMRFLIPFDSLEQRIRAWDCFNADPEWAQIRGGARLSETTIYRQPGGRIFEMSL
jgi:hypothetical protein